MTLSRIAKSQETPAMGKTTASVLGDALTRP
jgi:hypothetical protein